MVYLLSIFGLNMLKQKSNTYICTTSFKPTSPNLASQTINPFTEPSVYTSIHEKYNYIYIYIDPLNHSFIYPPIHWTAHQSNHVLLPCAVQLHQSTNTRHYNQDFQATYPLYQSQTRAPPPQKKHSLTSGPLNIILVSFLLISYDVFLMFSLYK